LMFRAAISASPVLNCIPAARSSNHSIIVMSLPLPTTGLSHARGSSCERHMKPAHHSTSTVLTVSVRALGPGATYA
jgi:hypothetical protein